MSGYWAGPLTLLAINVVFACAINLPVAARQINLGGAGFQAVGAYATVSFFTRMPELLRAGLPALTEKLSALLVDSGPFSTRDESWRLVILGAVTFVMMVFRPEGLITRAAIKRLTHPRRRAKTPPWR